MLQNFCGSWGPCFSDMAINHNNWLNLQIIKMLETLNGYQIPGLMTWSRTPNHYQTLQNLCGSQIELPVFQTWPISPKHWLDLQMMQMLQNLWSWGSCSFRQGPSFPNHWLTLIQMLQNQPSVTPATDHADHPDAAEPICVLAHNSHVWLYRLYRNMVCKHCLDLQALHLFYFIFFCQCCQSTDVRGMLSYTFKAVRRPCTVTLQSHTGLFALVSFPMYVSRSTESNNSLLLIYLKHWMFE